jgi:hypothetical protein
VDLSISRRSTICQSITEIPIIEFLGGNLAPSERNNLLAAVNGLQGLQVKKRRSPAQTEARTQKVPALV